MAKRFAEDVEVTYRPEGLVYELHVGLGAVRASLAMKSALQGAVESLSSTLLLAIVAQ